MGKLEGQAGAEGAVRGAPSSGRSPNGHPRSSHPRSRQRSGHSRSGDILALVLMLFYLLSTLALALMAVVTAELQRRFGLSASQLGLLTSVFMFVYGAIGIPAGAMAARWGGRVLAASCVLFVAGSLVFGLSSSYGGFLAGRILQGLGGGMVLPVSSPVIARYLAPEARNRGWGIFATGKGLGALVGLLLMPSVATLGGFRAVYLVTAGMAVVIGVITLAQGPVRALPAAAAAGTTAGAVSTAATGASRAGRASGAVLLNGRVLLLGLFNAASLAVGTGVLIWSPDFLQSEYGASAGVAAYLTAGLAVAQLIGAPTGAAAAIRWGRMPVITGSMVAMSVVAVLAAVVPGRVLVFIMVALVGFFSFAYFSPRFAMIPEVVARPEHVGPASGLINLLGYGISMLAPWLFGLALDRGMGYLTGYLILAAFGMAGAVGSLFFKAGALSGGGRER
ncbi:MAG: MFS transporter [Thermoleophilia bacterium]|nr:MFS transporter [Thermoleophilia bacterium]